MMQQPLVSICIPTYNGAKFLNEALDSIIIQTYKNLEVIISDDNSQDDTLTILEFFKRQTKLPTAIINHKPNGIGSNWNNCIKHAQGKYIKFLFQDDKLLPKCVEEMVLALQEHTDCKMVACQRSFMRMEEMSNSEIDLWIDRYKNLQLQFPNVEGDFQKITSSIFSQEWFKKSPLNKIGEPICVMFEKSLCDELGYFDESLKQILDYEYWYRVLAKYPILIIKKDLVSFRIHESQATNVNRSKKIRDYEIYDELLYKDYYDLLHPILQYQLRLKFHKPTLLWNRAKCNFKSAFK
ncbi:glycosyltransferase [Nonlabens sp. Ci31]|uniref:glycosyltransferase family 2 protein n=1 Tax=Nonlabens sp. Ci31 TaxID=2608253 RepID=UPI001464776F|nr:glycosyltransferase [Nonlabens sp. Ci31]QJP32998.1 glycosyltransferase [Nonlabens sp. Ci31]